MSIDQYGREIEVEFEGEKYLVRDNGAVCRKHRPGHHKNSFDETWTFGTPNQNGYMCIASKSIHRIVAFAFLGDPPSKNDVVDHIDRNRTNNRIENLRWVSLLDNSLRHPSFRNQIIAAYGSLNQFFDDPRSAKDLDPSNAWLRSISKEDAARSRDQLIRWTESDGFRTYGVLSNRVHGNRAPLPPPRPPEPIPEIQSLTPMAVQRRWKTPTEFPGCPNELGQNPLGEYAGNLRPEAVFSRDRYKESWVVMAELGESLLSVLVESKEEHAIKPWAVAKVTFENGKFVHEGMGTFFDLNGAKKTHYGLLGISFSVESYDDYC